MHSLPFYANDHGREHLIVAPASHQFLQRDVVHISVQRRPITHAVLYRVPYCSLQQTAVSMVEHLWTNDECAQMGALDTIGKPGGLGWPKAMRVGTCRQILGKSRFQRFDCETGRGRPLHA